jgi:predicted HicB family RNase H-like nuclease
MQDSKQKKPKQIHIKLEPDLHQALKLEAALNDMSMQELVVSLIRQRIERSEFSGMLSDYGD